MTDHRERELNIYFSGRDISGERRQQLEEEVRTYLSENTHEGFTRGFKFERFEVSPHNGRILLVDAGLDEDIDKNDRPWGEGLARIGDKYNIDLRLHYLSYSK